MTSNGRLPKIAKHLINHHFDLENQCKWEATLNIKHELSQQIHVISPQISNGTKTSLWSKAIDTACLQIMLLFTREQTVTRLFKWFAYFCLTFKLFCTLLAIYGKFKPALM